jgi:hypothetical protein
MENVEAVSLSPGILNSHPGCVISSVVGRLTGNSEGPTLVSCPERQPVNMYTGHPLRILQLAGIGSLLLVPPAGAARGQSVSIRDGNAPLERCDQLEITFDNRPSLRDEEALQLPAGTPLRIDNNGHGGIALAQAAGPQHEITLCKAVPQDAGADLPAIRAAANGSTVEVDGPAGRPWVGYLLVRSPRGSHLSLSTTNGPLRAESFDGDLTLRTQNGPIALAQVRGRVVARAQNGPIKLEGGGGNVSLETQNGPIGVRLLGSAWDSGELAARAENGPLSVEVPDSYRSGVDVESSGNSPWSCNRDCGSQNDGSGTRRAHLGEGPTRVKLSTVNGPVKVR